MTQRAIFPLPSPSLPSSPSAVRTIPDARCAPARCAARLHELLEEPAGRPEAHPEVEQPASRGPFERDSVPPDLAGGAAVDGDGEAGSRHASTLHALHHGKP